MANYADSVWNAAQYILNEDMQKPEFKHKPSAALSAFLANGNFLIPASSREAATALKNSDQQVVEINILAKQATGAAAGNRTALHNGNINDSKKATATFTSYVAPFKYSVKQADRNIYDLGAMVAAQIRSAVIDLHGVIETAMLAQLNTSKSQIVVNVSPFGGTWDGTNHIFGVSNDDEKLLFERLRGFMRQQHYTGGIEMVHSEGFQQLANYLIQQGQGNSENLFWQMGGLRGYNSTELATSGYSGSCYMFEQGTVGLLDWIPNLNRQGFGDTFANGGSYSTLVDPLGSGLTFAVHQYAAGADNHSAAGERQDIDIEVEISVDLAPVVAPMTTSNASPIFKGGLLAL
jgi:hypothetical protein